MSNVTVSPKGAAFFALSKQAIMEGRLVLSSLSTPIIYVFFPTFSNNGNEHYGSVTRSLIRIKYVFCKLVK
jgi:hypothetical protein